MFIFSQTQSQTQKTVKNTNSESLTEFPKIQREKKKKENTGHIVKFLKNNEQNNYYNKDNAQNKYQMRPSSISATIMNITGINYRQGKPISREEIQGVMKKTCLYVALKDNTKTYKEDRKCLNGQSHTRQIKT